MAQNMQMGGWYPNPEQGGKTMRWWAPGQWTAGEDPTGGRGANWYQTAQPQQQTQPGGYGGDFNSILQQAMAMQQQAIQPQISAMEAQRPLAESRYQQLLKDITQYSTRATAGEYSRRGIPLSSGIYEQALAGAIEPRVAEAGQQRETTLANIAQQIAALQGGALSGGSNLAMQLTQLQQQQAQRQWEQQMYAQEWPYKQRSYEYELGKPYYKPSSTLSDDWE